MDAPAGLGLGDPLDAVDPGLKLHPGEGAVAGDQEVRLLDAAELGLVIVQKLQLPASGGRVHGVHPEQAVGEEGALLAADAAADLHDDVLVVVGVPGQEEDAEPVLQLLGVLLRGLVLLLEEVLHLGLLGHQGQGLGHVGLRLFPGAKSRDHGGKLPLFLQKAGRLLRVGVKIGLLCSRAQLVVSVFHLGQFFFHNSLRRSICSDIHYTISGGGYAILSCAILPGIPGFFRRLRRCLCAEAVV